MKILITGGAGYIGSVLTPMLLNEGHEVTVIDNFMYKQTSLLDVCWQPKFNIIRGDARDKALLKKEMAKADAILPLACYTGAPLCSRDPVGATTTNYEAVVNVAELKSPNQMVVYPCTNSGYGIGQDGIECDENSPLKPVSLYGKLKVDAEKVLLDRGDCVTFRLATVFGVSPRPRLDLLVNDFTYRALNDRAVVLFEPHFKRNYLHVRDASRAFMHALANYDKMKGRPFNVGLSEANLSKYELCQVIQELVPEFRFLVSDVGEDPDKRNYIVSNARIEATGFKTQTDLRTGIRELLKGYQIMKRMEYANA